MMNFEPPELRTQIAHAIRQVEKALNIDAEDLGHDLVNAADPDFDPAEYDDLTITRDTDWDLWLPHADESIRLTYGDLVDLSNELTGAELVDGVEAWTSKRLLLRVVPIFHGESFSTLEKWLDEAGPDGALSASVRIDLTELSCSFHRGSTIFGLLVVAFGYYDKYFPPATSDEYFIEVRASASASRSVIRTVADAYMFELASSLRLDCRLSRRPDADELFPEDESAQPVDKAPLLRPLLLGPGLDGVIAIYNAAIGALDSSFEILGFVKVIEHVSQTVIRLQMTDAIRAKLASPRALSPDAAFIMELENIVAEQRTLRKDREALRATIHACCEATELSNVAPEFLGRLRGLDVGTDEKQRRAALDELAAALSATRNWIAHAKAGYTPTGEECPPEQLPTFAVCARLAAEQCIRWYAARHESARVL
jgi:hypothetical protein